jgi:acetyltransferase-like isoleucine patch superfamily enzyme
VPQSAPITIGPGVWCGVRVTIGAGVTIGGGSVIGAASLVLQNIPAGRIAYGVPCKPQRELAARSGHGRWSNFRRHTDTPA